MTFGRTCVGERHCLGLFAKQELVLKKATVDWVIARSGEVRAVVCVRTSVEATVLTDLSVLEVAL